MTVSRYILCIHVVLYHDMFCVNDLVMDYKQVFMCFVVFCSV